MMQTEKQIPALWKHQKDAIPQLTEKNEYALFYEAGTGKTATMIHALRKIYAENKRIQRTLIFAPSVVLPNWKNEFGIHSKIKPQSILVLNESGKKRVQKMEKQIERDSNFIAVTNYEAVLMPDFFRCLLAWKPEILVCDESHRLKNHQSKRAKAVYNLALYTKRRYLLTGTPVLNSALDLFMQLNVMERGRGTFGSNFYVFRATYFYDANAPWKGKQHYFPKWEPRASAHQELNEIIAQKSARVLKKDCLDLPPLVRQKIFVDLSPEQKRLYESMKKDYIAFLQTKVGENKSVVAQLALTKALRLQQIVSGFVKTDTGEEIPLKEIPRLAALSELLEDLTPVHKILVWCVFRKNYSQIEKLCTELKIPFASITGELSAGEKQENLEAFQMDPTIRVMIANQSAGGIGINLTAASYSIFFSRNFSLEADLQAEARNYRGGSEIHEKITRIDLVTPGTIDELVLEALANKQKISDEILGWEKLI